ncbi:MAG: DUF697 domain-containing protein [Bacteroidota bacterium]
MTTKNEQANQVIENHVWFATVPGLIPFPVLDVIGITAVQLDMVKQLCKVYGKDYDEQKGKALTLSLFSTVGGRLPAYFLRAGLKAIPVVGSILGGVSLAGFAQASTYATGVVFKEHFAKGGTLNDLNPDSFRKFYEQQFQRSQERFLDWKKMQEQEMKKDEEQE